MGPRRAWTAAIGITPCKCVKNALIWGVLFQQSSESKAGHLACPFSLMGDKKITEQFEIHISFIFRHSFSIWGQPFCFKLAFFLCMFMLPLATGPAGPQKSPPGMLLSAGLKGKGGVSPQITRGSHGKRGVQFPPSHFPEVWPSQGASMYRFSHP